MASTFYTHEMPSRIIDERAALNMNLINDSKQLVNNSSNSNKLKLRKTEKVTSATGFEADELCSGEGEEEEEEEGEEEEEEDEEGTNRQTKETINKKRKKGREKNRRRRTKLREEVFYNNEIHKRNHNHNEKLKECDLRTAMAPFNIANCKKELNQTKLPERRDDKLGNESKLKLEGEKLELPLCFNRYVSFSDVNNIKKIIERSTFVCLSPSLSSSLSSVLPQTNKTTLNSDVKQELKNNKLDCCEDIKYNKITNDKPSQKVASCLAPVLPQLQRRKFVKHRNSCSSHQLMKVLDRFGKSSSSFETNQENKQQYQTSQCTSNQMILTTLAQLVIIYIIITSSIVIPVTTTNYWPLRKQHNQYHQQQEEQQNQLQRQQQQFQLQTQSSVDSVTNGNSGSNSNSNSNNNQPPRSHQLLIGQHYNNFSSIVPYSIVQDSDYANGGLGGSDQEDQVMDEQEEQQAFGSSDTSSARIVEGITSTNLKSRALLPLDSNRLILPQMQQIKSRFNQGCVGGTKCQFFAFCWMSGGSLGASCGLLMTCCVTPSRQEIQPGFYGPVVNDPCKYSAIFSGFLLKLRSRY